MTTWIQNLGDRSCFAWRSFLWGRDLLLKYLERTLGMIDTFDDVMMRNKVFGILDSKKYTFDVLLKIDQLIDTWNMR